MKRIIFLFFIVAFIGCSKKDEQKKDNLKQDYEFITSDIDLFWEVFDFVSPNFTSSNFKEQYIDKGSVGLKDYAAQKDLANGLEYILGSNSYLNYYHSVRNNTLDIESQIETVKLGFRNFKDTYDDANFFDVYFLIGALSAGGRVSNNGLLIAVEMFSKTVNTSLDDLSDWHRNVIRSKDYIPSVVVHELIHNNQTFYPENIGYTTTLEQAILEGMADYLSFHLLPGEPFMNQHLHEFGDANEQMIWNSFQSELDMNYRDTEWFYTGNVTSEGYPADMGYYVGFKILESYAHTFNNFEDALEAMLENPDYNDIFENSGYQNKFITQEIYF